MNNAQIIATYETILSITEQMLQAAKSNDWNYLMALEEDCQTNVAKLLSANPAPLSGEFQQRKVEIIHKVLADDAEIRNITQPWMSHLQGLIGSIGHERKLEQAYGSDSHN
jgi:flagellar protein FliT